MEHVRSFSGFPGLDKIRTYLSNDQDRPAFQKSELYSSSSKVDAKIVNEDLRKSQFRILEDNALFQHVENVVSWLNDSYSTFAYQLQRDNITETRYEAGGHFLKHKASAIGGVCCHFLIFGDQSFSNYFLLNNTIHLLSKNVGFFVSHFQLGRSKGSYLPLGRRVHVDSLRYSRRPRYIWGRDVDLSLRIRKRNCIYDTTTPGNGLVFRKDLEHAGEFNKYMLRM